MAGCMVVCTGGMSVSQASRGVGRAHRTPSAEHESATQPWPRCTMGKSASSEPSRTCPRAACSAHAAHMRCIACSAAHLMLTGAGGRAGAASCAEGRGENPLGRCANEGVASCAHRVQRDAPVVDVDRLLSARRAATSSGLVRRPASEPDQLEGGPRAQVTRAGELYEACSSGDVGARVQQPLATEVHEREAAVELARGARTPEGALYAPGARAVQCMRSAYAVHMHAVVHAARACRVCAVRMQCTCSARAVQMECTCDAYVVHMQCTYRRLARRTPHARR